MERLADGWCAASRRAGLESIAEGVRRLGWRVRVVGERRCGKGQRGAYEATADSFLGWAMILPLTVRPEPV